MEPQTSSGRSTAVESPPVRVLVVDGEPDVLDAAETCLRDRIAAVEVVTATTAAGGLEVLGDRRIDCVVSRYGLPDGTGLDLLHAVRAESPDRPFVMFVDRTDGEAAAAAKRADVTAGVTRHGPDAPERLAATVERTVSRWRARGAVGAHQRWFQTLLEASSDVILVLDGEGRIEYVSPAVEHVLGYDPAALHGDRAFDYVHPDDREAVVETYVEAVEDAPDEPPRVEYRCRHADGSWRVLESYGRNRLDDPPIGGFVITARDITERKRRERELTAYETIVEASPDTIYALDSDFEFMLVNEHFKRRTGLSEDDVLGEPITLLVEEGVLDPELLERAEEEAWRVIRGETDSVTFESPVQLPEGEIVTETRIAAFPAGEGEVGLVQIVRDITERKRFEERLQRQNERLDEFASVVSHDLRNPLNVARGNLELAMETGDPSKLETVRDAHDRMEALIEDLLSLARQGDAVDEVEPVDPAEAAHRAWSHVRTSAAALEIDGDPGPILADADRLVQLLENLFRNAVEHGTTGSRPSDGDAVEHGSADVTVRVGTTDGGFYVADDGPGIPPDERDRLFDRGYTTAEDGTGFGLAIVETIAEAHGWTVAVGESAAGGARFDVTGVDRD